MGEVTFCNIRPMLKFLNTIKHRPLPCQLLTLHCCTNKCIHKMNGLDIDAKQYGQPDCTDNSFMALGADIIPVTSLYDSPLSSLHTLNSSYTFKRILFRSHLHQTSYSYGSLHLRRCLHLLVYQVNPSMKH